MFDVQRDGHCLFECFSWCVFGTDAHKIWMREMCCEYLINETRADEALAITCEFRDTDWQNKMKRMRSSADFAEVYFIAAYAAMFAVDAVLHYVEPNSKLIMVREFNASDTVPKIFQWQQSDIEWQEYSTFYIIPPEQKHKQPLHLIFNHEHYMRVFQC